MEVQHQQQPNNADNNRSKDLLAIAILATKSVRTFLNYAPLQALIDDDVVVAADSTLRHQQRQPSILYNCLLLALSCGQHHNGEGVAISATSSSDDEDAKQQLQAAAIDAWQELVLKFSMEEENGGYPMEDTDSRRYAVLTMPMLDSLLDSMHAILPSVGESTSDIEVVIKAAELVNALGLGMTEIDSNRHFALVEAAVLCDENGHRLNPSAEDSAATDLLLRCRKVLDLFFRAFRYDDIDVSAGVLPLAAQLATSASADGKSGGRDLLFSRILGVLYQQIQYPEDFAYDHEDEDDAEEEIYLAELCKLYVKMVRTAPSETLDFLCKALADAASLCGGANSAVPANGTALTLARAPTPVVEACLRLVYHYCEGIRPAPGLKVVMRNATFREMLVALHRSDVSMHPHRQVLCLYYDVAVRYHLIFGENSDLLGPVLSALTGPCGLSHPHPRVRSRCCYLLLKLVQAVVKMMRPYVETAVTGICNLLDSVSTSSAVAAGTDMPTMESDEGSTSVLLTADDVSEFSHVLWGMKSKGGDALGIYEQSFVVAVTASTGSADVVELLRSASSAADVDRGLRELLSRTKGRENGKSTTMMA